MKKRSTRGAARVNAIWLIVLLVLLFASLFAFYTAADDGSRLQEKLDAAETTAADAVEKFNTIQAEQRQLSEILGYFDQTDLTATTNVELAVAGLEQFKAAIGTDAGADITTFEAAWPLSIRQISSRDESVRALTAASTDKAAEVATVRSTSQTLASDKDTEIAKLTKDFQDLQETTREEINGLEAMVARLTQERNERDQGSIDARDELAQAKVAHALVVSEYEARLAQVLNMTEAMRQPNRPDGEVLSTSARLSTGFINRGLKHRIVAGMSFDVLSADKANPKYKGRIEVVNVGENQAEVAIREVADKYDAITAGDIITNPLYDPEGGRNAVLAGRFDGKYNREEVSLLLKEIGINVQEKVDRSTWYLVMGNDLYRDPETGDVLESPLQVSDLPVYGKAKSYGVKMISIAELRDFFRR